ncbi:intermembrane lipid transfer protein VPS13B isoform X2 [Episyrphus balteatus]|uniref:intermembrane lipid transfer protein VPS13B isoform X2 n=1 Tax=Episyrphus balteatus TaxID=286459 RepID=UPI002484DAAD|nr:intermembrane lipid transfer protein VPS13B isoform X2 [Episyrphus balteatus]
MFKLESYITPIILNHVAKYVKNIRPEDSQVSLWEGEVAFQNLDLRLDVLEEELNLPFEFLSGHVHELSILVPWMKITSEPIKITINTIEFVLKLKDSNSESPSPKKTEKKKRISKVEDGTHQQQGYMPGLVNKIINNMVINCHNIILKYVEEDIVVSMNIQLLSFSSADESWKPAFTDIHPLRVFMRKLVQVSDLTICLDKRNAAGQIDVCQEPILYRCSLEMRIVRKYNINTFHLGSITRIAIFTKLMEMNVSSLQFPMAMRLFKLLMALKNGELKSRSTANIHDDDNDVQEGAASASGSYLNWAWNLIPSFGLTESEEEETVEEELSGQLLDIGIYVEALNFTLKSSEFITDSIVGATKKIRYSPIVKVILGGMYSETVMISDKNWSNTKSGCSSIAIEPLDGYKDEDADMISLVTSAPLCTKAFLDRSLFDKTFVEKDWNVTTIEEYNARVTEEYLLYRSPAMAFDLVQYKEETDDDEVPTSKSDENKIRIVYRMLASSMTLRHNQTYCRIAAVLQELIAAYDYPPYVDDKTDATAGSPKLHPPLLEDYDSLMTGIPLRIYKFNLSAINIEFHPKTEPLSIKTSKKLPLALRKNLPYFKLSFENVEGQWTTPLDTDKLVHTTCQLPDKPIELLNACYANAQLRFKNVSLKLKQQSESSKIFNIPKGSIYYGDLLQPALWKNGEVPLRKIDVAFDSFALEFSKSELVLALRLWNTVREYDSQIIRQMSKQDPTLETKSVRVRSQFKKLSFELKKLISTTMYRGSLKLLQSFIVRPSQTEGHSKINLFTTVGGHRNKWLDWYFQMPNDFTSSDCTKSVVALWMEDYNLLIDENLVDFLQFMETPETLISQKELTPEANPSTPRAPMVKQSSKKSLHSERLPSRRISYPEETIHVSSERDEKANIETSREKELREQFSYSKILPFIKSVVVRIQIAKGNVRLASSPNKQSPNIANYTEITLPKLLFSSASAEHIDRFNVQNEFKLQNSKPCKDTFPWTCSISDFAIKSSLNNIAQEVIHPIQTSITIAMTHRKETLSVSKTEQQQQQKPTVVEKSETDKTKLSASPTITTVDSGFSPRTSEDFHRKTTAGGSVSANGRSQSSEENGQNSIESDKRKSYLQEAVEIVFSGRRKSQTRDIVAISLHVDTSPIHVEFGSERTQLMLDHLSFLSKTVGFLQMPQNKTSTQEKDEIQIVTAAEENANLKQFLEMDTNSETSMASIEKSSSKFVASYLLQWTITKFTAELDASKTSKCKLVFDMEDLITSVDKQEDFTKFSNKVGTLNMRFFEMGAGDEFVLSDRLRIKMVNDSTHPTPFFNMIITTVSVKNFFKRIGAKRKETDHCRAISEVIVKMEEIEMIIDLDKLAILAPALKALTGGERVIKKTEPTSTTPCTAYQLPMVHLESRGFTVYIPTESSKTWCSVAIFKTYFIKISPNLENPLQRCPVRTDVFQKAAQMGILGTPGSVIEDRQYEMTFGNISAATGNWNEILTHMKEHADNFRNTNPAFEWNNQSRKNSLELRKIFKNMTFVITYAPCITCNNVLVCGQAIEFNCMNDLVADLSMDQLSLLSCIIIKMENIMKPSINSSTILKKSRKSSSKISLKDQASNKKSKEFKSTASFHSLDKLDTSQREESFEKPITDSGFSSSKRSFSKKLIRDSSSSSLTTRAKCMPHTTSFVAGIFIINLFNYSRIEKSDSTIVEKLTPLLSLHCNQPSFMISQTIFEVTKRYSLFNFAFSLYHPTEDEEIKIENDDSEDEKQVPETIFDTKRGEVDSSGIPPPLFVLKSHITKSKKHEIDLSFSKPATLRLSETSIKLLTEHMVLFYETLLESSCFNARSEKSIFRATKIQMMKNMFLQADRFNLKIDMVSLKFSEDLKYNMKVNLADIRLSTRFLNRPEKMNIKGSMGGLYVESNKKIIIHPIGVKFNFDFVQESWNRLPMVTANMKFNVIQCDIGAETISNYSDVMKAYRAGMEASNSLWEDFLRRRCGNDIETNRERLQKVYLPEVEHKKTAEPKEEFYQDDLRAGAFQFVEMVSDTFLPMPYQIQIIKKNYGIICWRYPQPRKMAKIHIFPVPMAVPNPIRIKCRMEYYSEAHESFLHYCDFWLSETVSLSIQLPDREITANIWRVVIQQSLVSINRECFDTSEEDEELRSIVSIGIDEILNSAKKESDFILHPKVLVGCMRIDTIFRPCAIPKFQILLNINEMQINLQNHQSIDSKLPVELKKFKISENSKPINQTFARIGFEKTSIHASFHTLSNYSIHSELKFGIKCLDHGYLNLISMIEDTDLSAFFRINSAVETSIVADRLSLNLGPSILHNLICAKQNWEAYFREESDRKSYLISKFIVANRTHTSLSFGQSGTDERILLNPKECCKYSFHSDCFGQELTFYLFDGRIEHKSNSVGITLEFPASSESIVNHVPIDDKCLVVRTRKLSATQYYILIKGQIELISMVNESFLLEFYRDDKKTEGTEIRLDEKDRATFLQPVMTDSNICIRLKMEGEKGKGQTGNIPLKSNKSYPWLVKVPVSGPDKYISYWIRIIRESIPQLYTDTYHPEKILICIWPIFEVRSMMTCPMNAIESSTNNQFIIAPEGKSHALSVPATHQTDHRITFNDDFKTAPDFNLTLKAIDWNKFFWYDEKIWTVDKSLAELSKPAAIKWPMNDEEELRIRRNCMDTKTTSLLYKCSPSREFSCTLSLEVAPWGTFINATGQKIAVQNSKSMVLGEIVSNAIGMLPLIKSEFTIAIENGGSWVSSLPIIFDKSVEVAKRKCYRLNENDSTDIVILREKEVFKFYLTFCTENERNVFVLKPKYVIANMTKQPLVVLPFCLDHKETTGRKNVEVLGGGNGVSVSVGTTSEYSIGMCIDGFHDLNVHKSSRSTDSAFVFFVCIKVTARSDVSIPITLMHPFNRKCFSVQQNESSVPLSASLIEKSGQFFLNIFDDTSPMILLNNQTDLPLLIGQTTSSENSKVSNTIPEYDGKHCEWYQISRPHSRMYYTPPTTYANFPDVENSVCNISIALYNENITKKTIKWSKSIKTNASWEKFLHIPAHGDVKVIVCDKHRIIRVSIFYIAQQLEFSVKDLRSRLLTPQSNDSPENTSSNAQDIDTILNDEPLQRIKPSASSQCIHQSCDPSSLPNAPLKILFSINEINVKIFVECKSVDYLKKEIFALYIDDFLLSYNNSKRTLNLQLTNLQIDNQLFSSGNYDFPVILCSQELYKRSSNSPSVYLIKRCHEEERPSPMAEVTMVFYDDELKVSSVTCRLSPIRTYIEDTYLNEVLDYLVECAPGNVVSQSGSSDFYVNLAEGEFLIPKDIVAKALYISEPMKMQSFRIESMNVLLSVHTCVRLYIALDHSPLQFSSYERQDILTLPLRFGHTLGMHYLSGALFGAGWVVGSLEMLGSPSGLARSFSMGLKDFVSMPVQGLLRGPWGFVVGVTQGSASLLRNVTAGTVNSVSKLAASVSRNLDRLTLDPEHIQRTEALRRCRPQGFTEGFTQGITGLGISILGAVGGIARHTLEARTTSEVVTGMGKGIVGALTKPISGAAELLALTGQGVLHTVGFNTMPHQRSPSVPRNIAVQISEQKVWNLLLRSILKSVLEKDQILFYNEVTLVVDGKLCPGSVFLTSTILALFDSKSSKFSFINPSQRLELSFDANDKTLLNVCVKKQRNEFEEGSSYTNQRIMSFLQTSGHHMGMSMTTESFDDILKKDSLQNSCSFYLSEHLGQYLIEYLKIINLNNS